MTVAIQEPYLCPICERAIKKPHKAKPLYGYAVCKRCRNGFANRRQLAYLIDRVCLLSFPAMLIEIYAPLFFSPNLNPMQPIPPSVTGFFLGLYSPIAFFITWILPLVFFCKEAHQGKSLGKWVTGVQVVDRITREPIGLVQSLKRNVIMLIPFSALLIAGTMMKGERLGERWATTVVIWDKYRFKKPFDPRGMMCMKCGYNLTGNTSGRCPECFTPIPEDISVPQVEPTEPTA